MTVQIPSPRFSLKFGLAKNSLLRPSLARDAAGD
jgi:hypothetical protein